MSFKLAGHTMGTPEYSVQSAMRLFKNIGLDGAEIIVQDGYRSALPTKASKEELTEVKKLSAELSLPVIALTPYYSHFNSLNEEVRRADMDGLKRVIDMADFLGAKYIRVYGGNFAQHEDDPGRRKFETLVKSLRELGDYAQKTDVNLVVENHFNTMAVSALQSLVLISEVDHPRVGILYDQANLAFTLKENWREAMALQFSKVMYTHVKDLLFKEGVNDFVSDEVSHPKEEDRNVVTRIVGEGCLPWDEILGYMQDHGYNGWLSLEYERRWHPDDIPEAAVGMKKSAEHLRGIIKNLI